MARQKKPLQTQKRFRHVSFKDRVDSLRIEPAKHLEKRAYDYVESSHFLASFEHWRDINLSKNFTEFGFKVSDLIQTLPQIIHHERTIFSTLIEYINKHDERSLQPLLELLSQFCHDLGPDFLPFYEEALQTLISLLDSSNKFDSPDALEWGFNCLAYLFKYLSRVLSQDLVPTFTLLLPLLSHPREFMSRFSAEALSFLIRKAKVKNLESLLKHFCESLKISSEDSNLYKGLLTLFTGALVSSGEALHSRSTTIMDCLIRVSFQERNDQAINLLCDIWMEISNHASMDSISHVYHHSLELLDREKDTYDINHVIQFLSVIVYAEAGRKIDDWSPILNLTSYLLAREPANTSSGPRLPFLFAVMLRNADIRTLAKFHEGMFRFLSEGQPQDFLPFYSFCRELTPEKLGAVGGWRQFQKFLNTNWQSYETEISLYLLRSQDREGSSASPPPSIPEEFAIDVENSLKLITECSSSKSLSEILWRAIILCHTKNKQCTSTLIEKAQLILSQSNTGVSDFQRDVLGILLEAISQSSSTDSAVDTITVACLGEFCHFQTSIFFVRGLNKLLKSLIGRNEESSIPDGLLANVIQSVGENCCLPDSQLRYESMSLLTTVIQLQKQRVPQILEQCMLLEQIPLDLGHGRDITARIRNIGLEFTKIDPNDIIVPIFLKYLFGLLSIRFSPVWEGVFEIIPEVYGKAPDVVWKTSLRLINRGDEIEHVDYPADTESPDPVTIWKSQVPRLEVTLEKFSREWAGWKNPENSVISYIKSKRGSLSYPPQFRSQILKLLFQIPELVERNSGEYIRYLFNNVEAEAIFGKLEGGVDKFAGNWSEQDRNMLLKILGKFKNLQAIEKSADVRQRLLKLLCSRDSEVQKLSLNALLCYNDPVLTKFKDNLRNLLDEALFKDEMTLLLSNNEDRIIEKTEEQAVMPYIIRILFGRAQTPVTSGAKKSKKMSVLSVLPNLDEVYIREFLDLGSRNFNYPNFFNNGYNLQDSDLTLENLRRLTGFTTVFNASLEALGNKFPSVIYPVIRPLLYSVAVSYKSTKLESDEGHLAKVGANLRQRTLRCLSDIFEIVGNEVDWADFVDDVYNIVIKPRIPNFADENLQQVSSLLRIVTCWLNNKALYPFMYTDNFSLAGSLIQILSNHNSKPQVVELILDSCNNLLKNTSADENYISLVGMMVNGCLEILPSIFSRNLGTEIVSAASELLLTMVDADYIQNAKARRDILNSLLSVVDGRFKSFGHKDTLKILKVLEAVILEAEMPWDEFLPLYRSLSSLYMYLGEKQLRVQLNFVFRSISSAYHEMTATTGLLMDLNSYPTKGVDEYDFPRILAAFKRFTDGLYRDFNPSEWLPVVYTCLHYIHNDSELTLRTNSSHCLKKYIDFVGETSKEEKREELLAVLRDVILSAVRDGLRRYEEDIQSEYISVLSYAVENSKLLPELEDMRVLMFDGDEEANFFANVNHIQLHRRQRAIRRLADSSSKLSSNSVSHYLIPMIEHYVFTTEEKYANIGQESRITIGVLTRRMSWKQYRSLLRRYMSLINTEGDNLKQTVLLINEVSLTLRTTLEALRGKTSGDVLQKLSSGSREPDNFVIDQLYPRLSEILGIRDDETIVWRIPLSEALVNFVMGLDEEDIVRLLPGILTKICHILKSRNSDLRDSVRATLARIAANIGPHYLPFIIKELTAALQRGSQVHVLGYTVHYIIKSLHESLKPGDLDGSASLIVSIIMEDLFGSAGQEKDSENYRTTMKEVKTSKSNDTGEELAANISLPTFIELLRPVKALLLEKINLKTQKRIETLLRSYGSGLHHNSDAKSAKILSLCYEVFEQSEDNHIGGGKDTKNNVHADEKEEFFLVNLNPAEKIAGTEIAPFKNILQGFALDLLRTVISRNNDLLTVSYMEGFIPILNKMLKTENEGVLAASLRVLNILVKLEFPEDSEVIFTKAAERVLEIIRDSPSTSDELCQVGLKFLSLFIKYKNVQLKDSAISYVLGRILPDLNEPSKQGLAFNFLKVLLSKHIMLPEIYDVMDTVRGIMVTNHSSEIRNTSRSAYFQFLMEYDQSKGRLEKQFKFLVDNLQYPSKEGRQSVMELINLTIAKGPAPLLAKLSSSFFVSLAHVAFSDNSATCREMAGLVLTNLLTSLDPANRSDVEKYILAWMKQTDNPTFLNLSLRTYKIYLSSVGLQQNERLDGLAVSSLRNILSNVDVGSETDWSVVYTALDVFGEYTKVSKLVYGTSFEKMWHGAVACVLYPQMWVRQAATRLVCFMLENLESFEKKPSDSDIQNIASRLLRQLSAPAVTEGLSNEALKALSKIATIWQANNSKYLSPDDDHDTNTVQYSSALEYLISRVGGIIRNEEKQKDTTSSKKACIRLYIFILHIMSTEQIEGNAEQIILSLYMFLEDGKGKLSQSEEELGLLAQECLDLLESKLSVASFSTIYANVKQVVLQRRKERKAKKAILAVNSPDIAAQKKLKKHARSRENRKRQKGSEDLYQRKVKKSRV